MPDSTLFLRSLCAVVAAAQSKHAMHLAASYPHASFTCRLQWPQSKPHLRSTSPKP